MPTTSSGPVDWNLLMQQLQEYGFGQYQAPWQTAEGEEGSVFQNISDISNITSQQISDRMTSMFGGDSQFLSPHLFQPISKSAVSSTLAKTYSPLIQQKGQSILASLMPSITGQKMTTASGGFAGSGQAEKHIGNIKSVYGSEMGNVLGEVGKSRAAGFQSLMDQINQWRETASDITYGNV